jgi:hypothetical protein
MSDVWIPLQGPQGVRPKAPAVGAWQSPGYTGVSDALLKCRIEEDNWYGLRCDGFVVIDCDSSEAADWWVHHVNGAVTWERKTPRGWHFIYERHVTSPSGPAVDIFRGHPAGIDIRAGRTSQIVFHAPGYYDVSKRERIRPFDPAWLLGVGTVSSRESTNEEWDEMPDGRGNNTMTALGGAMRKQGMSTPTIAKCLSAINRITMTRDPMPIEMVCEIAKSVGRYAARPDIDIELIDDDEDE